MHSGELRKDATANYTVRNGGECPDELLMMLVDKDWHISKDAFGVVQALMASRESLPLGEIKLVRLTATECGGLSTSDVIRAARRRGYRLAQARMALLLATQLLPSEIDGSYVVVMSPPTHVSDIRGVYRGRVLAISKEYERPGLVAPRADSEYPWKRDRVFLFLAPVPQS